MGAVPRALLPAGSGQSPVAVISAVGEGCGMLPAHTRPSGAAGAAGPEVHRAPRPHGAWGPQALPPWAASWPGWLSPTARGCCVLRVTQGRPAFCRWLLVQPEHHPGHRELDVRTDRRTAVLQSVAELRGEEEGGASGMQQGASTVGPLCCAPGAALKATPAGRSCALGQGVGPTRVGDRRGWHLANTSPAGGSRAGSSPSPACEPQALPLAARRAVWSKLCVRGT